MMDLMVVNWEMKRSSKQTQLRVLCSLKMLLISSAS